MTEDLRDPRSVVAVPWVAGKRLSPHRLSQAGRRDADFCIKHGFKVCRIICLFLINLQFFSRSQALPGNVILEALPQLSSWQSHKDCVTRQSLVTSWKKTSFKISDKVIN